jgi:uncharacterized membrane protein
MSLVAIAVVLLSALLHATWNFFNKGSGDRWGFFLAQGLVLGTFYAPVALWLWGDATISASGWMWITFSAIAHVGYGIHLLKAYDAGDLSVAYPLSRTAPVLVALWDVATARGEVTVGGVGGVLLSGCGALLLQLPGIRAHGLGAVLRAPVTRYALITALFVALFTIIDKQGVGEVHPFLYLYFLSIGESALMALWLRGGIAARLRGELRKSLGAILFAGIMGGFSYLLILWALTDAPASYVLGLRQCSIVFGVLLGWFFLGEKDTRYRLLGAIVISAGSALIAAFG